ncbi:Os03g0233750 [Oryza sativa Japonica Group]|uniref:Os03g0233750 protein n=1 Tax=Oryza sativa subsp. japonica TaxID=39947 RepID=C7J0L3_ORYSJ|nr:Os03g0233750 [Oryza sativa Japonica Group]|eukprot:NP_001173333.1 Os03g0233750 [Oryza sativa Japonica Group]
MSVSTPLQVYDKDLIAKWFNRSEMKESFQTSSCTSTKDRGKVWHGLRALARLFAEGDTLAEQMERCRSEEWLRPIPVLSL